VIDAVLNDRPAEAAGLRTGDRIVGVESAEGRQREARDLSDEDFAAFMHGVPGTVLRMSVLRATGGEPQSVQIVRAKNVVRDMGCWGGVTALAVTADG
jgi:C-terminal processing protease CtpA/Prc